MVSKWKSSLIGDIFDFKNGLNKGKSFFGHGTPIVNYIDVYKKRSLFKADIKGKVSLDADEIKRFEVKKNDVFFTRTSETPEEVGISSVLLDDVAECVFSGFVLRARPKNNMLYPEYCKYCFSTPEVRTAIIMGCTYTTRALTNGKQLSTISIPVPPLSEQQRIAEALSDMDRLIASLEKLIEKKKAIKEACLQKMFPKEGESVPEMRLSGFTDPWEQRKANELCSITTGKSNSQDQIDDGKYPFYIRSDIPVRSNRYLYDEEAVITIGDGNIGKVFHYVNGKFDLHQRCYKMADFKGVLAKYFYYFFSTRFYDRAMKMTAKATVDSVRLEMISDMEILLPKSYDEQKSIAEYLSALDNLITLHQRKLEKCKKIKQAMMQQLLTGTVRLISNEGRHNQHFDDAVVIAGIVDKFYSDYPLGRKKVQKLLYLFRRHQEADTSVFKKKAAGPYADEVRYKGGEPIAINKKYIYVKKGIKGSLFSRGERVADALSYVAHWGLADDFKWLFEQFKYTKTEKLELIATIDMAICDLEDAGSPVNVSSLKSFIQSNPEWKHKLTKSYFSDIDIAWAIKECKRLFG